MCLKIPTILVVITLNLVAFHQVQVQGCKLFCMTCASDVQLNRLPQYYCCMENWEDEPTVRVCGEQPTFPPTTSTTPLSTSSTTSAPTTPSTTASTTTATTVLTPNTPCPTVYTTTPSISRCPELWTLTAASCAAMNRIHPNPTYCNSDSDCIQPFNVCCPDNCFKGRICKTYRAMGENPLPNEVN